MAAMSQMQLHSVQEPISNIKEKIKGNAWQYEQLKVKVLIKRMLPPPSNDGDV